MNKYRVKFKNGEDKIFIGNAISNNDNGDYVIIGTKNENLIVIDFESFNYIEKLEDSTNVNSAPKAE